MHSLGPLLSAWTTGRLDDWTTGRLDDWTTGRLDDWSADDKMFEEWAGSRAPVFVDLGEPERLWCVFPHSLDSSTYVAMCLRAQFIDFLNMNAEPRPQVRSAGGRSYHQSW